MLRLLTLTAMLGLTACTGMINKKISSTYTKTVEAYSAEDIEAAMDGASDDIVRVLPSGRVLEGRAAVTTYVEDLFENNEDIDLKLVSAHWGGDNTIIIVYDWKSTVVGASNYSVDMTGSTLDNRGVVLLHLNDKREVDRMEDYYDTAKLAKPAGYSLTKPAPPVPEPEPAPAMVKAEGETPDEGDDEKAEAEGE